MSLLQRPLEEQLELASRTSSEDQLWELHTSPYMNVRRAVARNNNINSEIADILITDPVLNVSYMAKISSKATTTREFNFKLTQCVLCEKDELTLDCLKCESITNNMYKK